MLKVMGLVLGVVNVVLRIAVILLISVLFGAVLAMLAADFALESTYPVTMDDAAIYGFICGFFFTFGLTVHGVFRGKGKGEHYSSSLNEVAPTVTQGAGSASRGGPVSNTRSVAVSLAPGASRYDDDVLLNSVAMHAALPDAELRPGGDHKVIHGSFDVGMASSRSQDSSDGGGSTGASLSSGDGGGGGE